MWEQSLLLPHIMNYNTFKLHYYHYMLGILRLAMATTSMVTLTALLPPSMSSALGALPIPISKGMVMSSSFPLNRVFNLQEITICLTYRTLEMLGEQFECQHCVDKTNTGWPIASRTNRLDDLQPTGHTGWPTAERTYWMTYSRQDILDDLQLTGHSGDLQPTGHTGWPTVNRI